MVTKKLRRLISPEQARENWKIEPPPRAIALVRATQVIRTEELVNKGSLYFNGKLVSPVNAVTITTAMTTARWFVKHEDGGFALVDLLHTEGGNEYVEFVWQDCSVELANRLLKRLDRLIANPEHDVERLGSALRELEDVAKR